MHKEYQHRLLLGGFEDLKRSVRKFFVGDVEPLTSFVEKTVFSTLNPSVDSQGANELAFKLAILPYISCTSVYFVDSENHSLGGRIDIWCEILSSVRAAVANYYRDVVIELKRLPLNCIRYKETNQVPTTLELRAMSTEDLRNNLNVQKESTISMVQFEMDTIIQANTYGLNKVAHSAQEVHPLLISFICLGWARILAKAQEIVSSPHL